MLFLPPAQIPHLTQTAENVMATCGETRLQISLKNGRYDLAWASHAKVTGATMNVRLKDGRERCAADYTTHRAESAEVSDALGHGLRIEIHHLKAGESELVSTFWLYEGRPEAIVQVSALSNVEISTDRMLPVIGDGGGEIDAGDSPEVLFVPFDNDAWVRYHSKNWSEDGESYEVGATFDNRTRHGLVVGSLDHDTWKSAVQFRGRSGHRWAKMYAYAGTAGTWTRDREPHGFVSGRVVRSPRFSLAYYADWRDGMEAFGRLNARVQPALKWSGGPPLGWNSWSALKEHLNESAVEAAAGVVQQLGFKYVNLDACWTNIPDPELPKLVERIHAMGLKVGIYASPFSAWQNSLDDTVEGTDGRYKLRDIVLKDHNGNPFPRIDGGWPVDPTHPGTRRRNAWTFARFKEWGFDYVKLDFMHMGALEGKHYEPSITTGIQAYNFGMTEVDRELSGLFLSLSIAPLFPHGYAHSRRISCDAFADIGHSEYVLNSLTYGWWMHDTLYPFNDPDHTVVYRPNGDAVVSETEGKTRLTASIASGGMLLTGDDFTHREARDRVLRLFTKPEIIELARKGKTFRPLEGDTGSAAADAFVLHEGPAYYLALFNYDRDRSARRRIDLSRAGLGAGPWRTHDLWEGGNATVQSTLVTDLLPRGCALIRLDHA